MGKQKKNQRLETTKEVLKILGAAGLIAGTLVFPGLAQVWSLFDQPNSSQRYRRRAAFRQLQKREVFKLSRSRTGIKIILTKKGRRQILRHQISEWYESKPSSWDGRWWLVMFDIPEERRQTRDILRWKLKQAGFITIQKSVEVYPYPCQDLILNLRNYYRLLPGELYVFEAKILEGADVLKRHFRL
ncbi:MAG: hypothetical protein HY397_03480 [Candidatus Doudnabacteria bacterium]|nr:hypothetical protein [Candidatus Doudnabacteria bacterium]